MRKKACLFIFCLSFLFVCTGCWNYRSLGDIAIVAGIAVDIDPESNGFKLTYEVVDLKNIKSSGIDTVMIESIGKTIFDAARNAKLRLEKKLFFGNTLIVVISEEIAKSGNVAHIIDWFLRDAEPRETTYILVSQEKTAADLLKLEGTDNAVISFEIDNIISDDHSVTSSTSSSMVYQVFNTLHTEGKSLTLSTIHTIVNNEKPTSEVNGIAVFKEEMLIGYLTPEEAKYYLLVTNQVEGGILTLSAHGETVSDISLEISDSKTKTSYDIEDGKLKIKVHTEISVYLAEISHPFDALDDEEVTSLEAASGAAVKQRMESIIKKVQEEYRSDIFGFGSFIHQKNPKLWEQVSDGWNDGMFPMLEVDVSAKVNITNSAYIKTVEEIKH